MPRAHRDVSHLVEREIKGRKPILETKQPSGVSMVIVVRVFGGQQHAGVEEPKIQCSGRVVLTKSAPRPP